MVYYYKIEFTFHKFKFMIKLWRKMKGGLINSDGGSSIILHITYYMDLDYVNMVV